jgi:hypothetical protein
MMSRDHAMRMLTFAEITAHYIAQGHDLIGARDLARFCIESNMVPADCFWERRSRYLREKEDEWETDNSFREGYALWRDEQNGE